MLGTRAGPETANELNSPRQHYQSNDRRGQAIVALRKAEVPAKPTAPDQLTLRSLFDKYERERTRTKSPQVQAHDRFARALFEQCWTPDVKVSDLGSTDWFRYIEQRRSGALTQTRVRDRQIESDLRLMLAVMNWAETVRENGRMLVERNPFRKLPVPTEANPRRLHVNEVEYQRLRKAAGELGAEVELFLAFAHETGHRRNSIRQLRWSDIDTDAGVVRWRAEVTSSATNIPPFLHRALLQACERAKGRAPRGRCFLRQLNVTSWGVGGSNWSGGPGWPRVTGRGWHSLRRKFATDLLDEPLPVVRDLGGWKGTATLMKCYQRPDEIRMSAALARRAQQAPKTDA